MSYSSLSNQSPTKEVSIRVLTLNCWGLWLGAKKRRERMAGIVRYLREVDCDIVFLQEVWVTSDFEIIRDDTKDLYRFAHLFRSGSVLGSSGIVILCKWLPKVIHFEPYSLNGSPFYPWHGDWFAGKGVAYSRVDFDSNLSLHLFSTHTHAYYKRNESVHDQYSVHRICQSYQLARFITFIRDTACNRRTNGQDLLIVAGDMNSTSSELPYKILTSIAELTDCFKVSRNTNGNSNVIHKHKFMNKLCSLTKGDQFLLDTLEDIHNDTDDEDITYCHPRNSFTPNRTADNKRIDFILCNLLHHGQCLVDKIAYTSKDTTLGCSLSDHEPVLVELKISPIGSSNNSLSSLESKKTLSDASPIEETTNQWVPEEVPVNLSYSEANLEVLAATQEILMQYYQYNRTSKTQLLYVVLLMFLITLPSATYYAHSNSLVPMSTIVFMWLAASFFLSIFTTIGFLSYRFEQGAIEATMNDITCKMTVAKDHLKDSTTCD